MFWDDDADDGFQSTPLTRGETGKEGKSFWELTNFNPLPSHEGRRKACKDLIFTDYFNPLPSHEGRPQVHRQRAEGVQISIHSPHTRGDSTTKGARTYLEDFNPLPSHEGRLP